MDRKKTLIARAESSTGRTTTAKGGGLNLGHVRSGRKISLPARFVD